MNWLKILVIGLMGLIVGEMMRRRLNELTYRLAPSEEVDGTIPASGDGDETARTPENEKARTPEDEDETLLPSPGSRWWIPAIVAIAWGFIAWRCPLGVVPDQRDVTGWARLLGWLTFSAVGLAMAVIDLDVRRLPDRGQILLAGASLIFGVLAMWEDPIRLAYGLGAALACGLAFLLIHVLSRGGLGLGDVKLVMTCGWWLGLISLTSVFAGLMVSCILAVAYSLLARQRQFAFGPWLIAGTVIAGLCLR